MITIKRAGDAALLLEPGRRLRTVIRAGTGPPSIAAAIRASGLPAVVEVVPGAATVLVAFEPGSWPAAR